jgi:hypothetical protein
MGELPIQAAIARVAIQAHRHGFVCGAGLIRVARLMRLVGLLIGQWRARVRRIFISRFRRRDWTMREFARRFAADRAQVELLGLHTVRVPHQFPDGPLGHAQALRDRPVAQSLALQRLDAAQPLAADTPATASPTGCPPQRRHPALCVALLVAAYCALGSGERVRDFGLLRESGLDQEHQSIGFGHRILGAIVVHRQSRHDDDALILFGAQAAARIDHHAV